MFGVKIGALSACAQSGTGYHASKVSFSQTLMLGILTGSLVGGLSGFLCSRGFFPHLTNVLLLSPIVSIAHLSGVVALLTAGVGAGSIAGGILGVIMGICLSLKLNGDNGSNEVSVKPPVPFFTRLAQ